MSEMTLPAAMGDAATTVAVDQTNVIVKMLPQHLLRKHIMSKLPKSHRFLAPVCVSFRDACELEYKGETQKLGIFTMNQMEVYFRERDENNDSVSSCWLNSDACLPFNIANQSGPGVNYSQSEGYHLNFDNILIEDNERDIKSKIKKLIQQILNPHQTELIYTLLGCTTRLGLISGGDHKMFLFDALETTTRTALDDDSIYIFMLILEKALGDRLITARQMDILHRRAEIEYMRNSQFMRDIRKDISHTVSRVDLIQQRVQNIDASIKTDRETHKKNLKAKAATSFMSAILNAVSCGVAGTFAEAALNFTMDGFIDSLDEEETIVKNNIQNKSTNSTVGTKGSLFRYSHILVKNNTPDYTQNRSKKFKNLKKSINSSGETKESLFRSSHIFYLNCKEQPKKLKKSMPLISKNGACASLDLVEGNGAVNSNIQVLDDENLIPSAITSQDNYHPGDEVDPLRFYSILIEDNERDIKSKIKKLIPLIMYPDQTKLIYTLLGCSIRLDLISGEDRKKFLFDALETTTKTVLDDDSIYIFKLILDKALGDRLITARQMDILHRRAKMEYMRNAQFMKDIRKDIEHTISRADKLEKKAQGIDTSVKTDREAHKYNLKVREITSFMFAILNVASFGVAGTFAEGALNAIMGEIIDYGDINHIASIVENNGDEHVKTALNYGVKFAQESSLDSLEKRNFLDKNQLQSSEHGSIFFATVASAKVASNDNVVGSLKSEKRPTKNETMVIGREKSNAHRIEDIAGDQNLEFNGDWSFLDKVIILEEHLFGEEQDGTLKMRIRKMEENIF